MSRTKVIIYFGQSKQIYISVSAPNYFQNQILINVSWNTSYCHFGSS